jgi:ribosomal protein S12 methylthiotransferase
VSARVKVPNSPVKPSSFYVETLGCPKNAVDSDKVIASLLADGLVPSADPGDADVVVVNTCAFIEAARQESIDVALALADTKRPDAKLVITGCMAERYGEELAAALPEADAVVGFANEGSIADVVLKRKPVGVRDLLELPRPAPTAPWAYVKVAEGCDRACAFCAIPTFRGPQRSRTIDSIESEARALVEAGVAEIVLVAQDLAWYGRDIGEPGSLAPLLRRLDALAPHGLARIRLLYLYPSEVRDPLVSTMLELPTVVPYFDLSLQHASAPLMRRMKRWGSGDRFRPMIEDIRTRQPDAVFRSSFIVGFTGETEQDHDQLLAFLADARLDWAGFFAFSQEDGTPAATMDGVVDEQLVRERLGECAEVQDPITNAARHALVGERIEVLVDGVDDDGVLVGRTHREAPEIDGVVRLAGDPLGPEMFARPGAIVAATVSGVIGPDLEAKPDLDAQPILEANRS